MDRARVVVIGGGCTGIATAYDLALRGLQVTVLEQGELASAASGRHHGLLHSGARYALTDRESARECIQENLILRRIMPGALELNNGFFVALSEADLAEKEAFLEGCAAAGIEAREVAPAQALRREPNLNPRLLAAVEVPDGSFDAWRLVARFLASARAHGADVRPFQAVTGLHVEGGAVKGVEVRDHLRGGTYRLEADLVVNAAGPWTDRVAALAGARVPVRPSPGVMVAVEGRLTQMVVNRLHRPGNGDIAVPQRRCLLLGTTSWFSDDPDHLGVPADHVQQMLQAGAELVPAVARAPFRAAWSAARPLVALEGGEGSDQREVSRSFRCLDHEAREGVRGLVSILGGKAITCRLMAEATADLVCAKLGVSAPCRTAQRTLLPHHAHCTARPC
ncbi:MAG: FAD-dependent oxidoreductase [Chloroflexi bacterium]|nr:FAD-dependent oxidoreductase [Chloroflexota bacterium]